jgi:hypothetical protein
VGARNGNSGARGPKARAREGAVRPCEHDCGFNIGRDRLRRDVRMVAPRKVATSSPVLG